MSSRPCENSSSTTTELLFDKPERYRTLITLAEYEQQGRQFTKSELKSASLYTQHLLHFFILGVVQRLFTRWVLWAVSMVCIAIVAGLLLGSVYGTTEPPSKEGGLVPSVGISQSLCKFSLDLWDWLSQVVAFQSKKGLLNGTTTVFTPSPRTGNTSTAFVKEAQTTSSSEPSTSTTPPPQADAAKQSTNTQGGAEGTKALVADTSFTTFLRTQTYKGLHLFSFAFNFAKELASNVLDVLGLSRAEGGGEVEEVAVSEEIEKEHKDVENIETSYIVV